MNFYTQLRAAALVALAAWLCAGCQNSPPTNTTQGGGTTQATTQNEQPFVPPVPSMDFFKPWDSVPVVVSVTPPTVKGGNSTTVHVDSNDTSWTPGTYFVHYSVVGDPNPDAWKTLLRDPPTSFWATDPNDARFQLRTAPVGVTKTVRVTIIGTGQPMSDELTITN